MSIELPEAHILAKQMNELLIGKKIDSYNISDYQKLQRVGFINKNIQDFDRLNKQSIEAIISRGNIVIIKFTGKVNLLLGLEYGGIAQFHTNNKTFPKKIHLQINFSDQTFLTVRLTGMGALQALSDEELPKSYFYRQNYSKKMSPIDDKNFNFEKFSKSLQTINRMLKSVIVGKEAIVVGLGNSAFQEIIFLAKLYPKRKALSLNNDERTALFESITEIIQNRIKQGGKTQFIDLYGNKGQYQLTMGSHIKVCPICQVEIEKLSISGGTTYYCPNCQQAHL